MDEKLKHLSIAKKLRYSFGCVLLATSVIFVAAIIHSVPFLYSSEASTPRHIAMILFRWKYERTFRL